MDTRWDCRASGWGSLLVAMTWHRSRPRGREVVTYLVLFFVLRRVEEGTAMRGIGIEIVV